MTTTLEEPFNDYTTAPWTLAGTPTPTIGAGRTGTAATLSGSGNITYPIPSGSQDATLTFGAALQHPAVTTGIDMIRFLSDSGATIHTNLRWNSNGSITALRGTISTLGVSAISVFPADTWYYLEVQAKLADSGGFVTVRVDGTTILSVPSADTKNAGTKTVYDTLQIRLAAGISSLLVDDLYLLSGAGETFRGDIHLGGAQAKVWNGATYVAAPIKVWNGATYVAAPAIKTWNGSAFV